MRFVLISSDEPARPGVDERAAFDRKLEQCFTGPVAAAVVIQLRADMAPSIELLEWLERWTRRLSEERVRCIIVPQTPAQLECLELSHPDQNLIYAASMDEIGPLLPPGTGPPMPSQDTGPVHESSPGGPELSHLEETKGAVPDPVFQPDSAPAINESARSQAECEPEGTSAADAKAPDGANRAEGPREALRKVSAAPIIAIGSVSTTSGEYACAGCRTSRMWLKGERMSSCINPECLNQEAGWRLEWDLF